MQAPLDEEALGEEESQEGGLGPALTLLKSILGGKQAEEAAPGPEVSPERREEFVSMGKISLERRREEIRRGALAGEGRGPSGEEMSYAVSRATLVEVSLIRNDPTFNNTRLYDEVFREDLATNEGQKLNDLERSMDEEGLKVPVTLTEGPGQSYFIVAGFRRIKCAKKLRWKLVPAIVLPRNTPLSSMYWCNILENATRKSLTTYETAKAAQLMRDKFGIKAADFARKTGYSESHVSKLLSCIDKLPESWISGRQAEVYRSTCGIDSLSWSRTTPSSTSTGGQDSGRGMP
jgi:ParB/RepB/Spo0J family partition protein